MERFIYGRLGPVDKNGNYKWYVRPINWAGIWKPLEKDYSSSDEKGSNDGVLMGGNVTATFDCEEWAREHCLQLNKAVDNEEKLKRIHSLIHQGQMFAKDKVNICSQIFQDIDAIIDCEDGSWKF